MKLLQESPKKFLTIKPFEFLQVATTRWHQTVIIQENIKKLQDNFIYNTSKKIILVNL